MSLLLLLYCTVLYYCFLYILYCTVLIYCTVNTVLQYTVILYSKITKLSRDLAIKLFYRLIIL